MLTDEDLQALNEFCEEYPTILRIKKILKDTLQNY